MSGTLARRDLQFSNLQEAIDDVRQLRQTGYQAVGNWDLTQSCQHIADWMEFPVQGFPPAGVTWPILAVVRWTIGPRILKTMLDSESMKPGNMTFPKTVYAATSSEELQEAENVAVARLVATVEAFEKHDGKIHPSPLFGAMDKSTAEHLQRIHCAHHLSFLIPK